MKTKILLFIVIISLVTLFVPSYAANSVTIAENGISEVSKNVTVLITTEDLDANDDLTILVFKVEDEKTEPEQSNIVYIDQNDFVEGKTQLTFSIPEDAEGLYEIRIGGSGVETYTSGRFSIVDKIIGDLNNDGKIDTKDAIIVLKVYLGKDDIEVTVDDEECDLNNDGIVNTKDAVWILKEYLSNN